MPALDLHSIFVFTVQAIALACALCVLGYPLKCAAAKLSPRVANAMVLPLYGLWPLLTVGWFWSDHFKGGLAWVLPVLVTVFLLADIYLVRNFKLRVVVRASLPSLITALGSGIFFFVIYRYFFALPFQTVVSFGNLDLAHFAAGAEHLRSYSFHDAGTQLGFNRGESIRNDTTGTFIIDLFPAALLDRAVWETTTSTLFTGIALSACQLTRLVHKGFRLPPVFSAATGSVVMFVPLVMFCIANGYMSQMWASSLLFAAVTVVVINRGNDLKATVFLLAILMATLWYLYPFVALVLLFIASPFAFSNHNQWLTRLRRVATIGFAAMLLSFALAPTRSFQALGLVSRQGSAEAGWPLPAIYPHELIGFANAFDQNTLGEGRAIGSVVVLTTILAMVVATRKRPRARTATIGIFLTLASYAAIYALFGESYQQWKWAALVSPLLVVSILVLLAETISIALPRRRWVIGAVPLLAAVTFLVNDNALTSAAFRGDERSLFINSELIETANAVASEQRVFEIRDRPWEKMWLTAMLPSHRTYAPGFAYTPTIRTNESFVLESVGRLPSSRPVEIQRSLTTDHQFTLRGAGQGARLTATNDPCSSGQWSLIIQNSGNASWGPDNPASLEIAVIKPLPSEAGASPMVEVVGIPQLMPIGELASGESTRLEGAIEVPQGAGLQFDVVTGSERLEVWEPSPDRFDGQGCDK